MRDFVAHEDGNYAVIFALAALPLMAGVGTSFDYVQASSLRSELTRSMDQAALAGSQEWVNGKSKREIEKTIKAFMLANLDPKYEDALRVGVKLPGAHGRNDRELKVSAKLKFEPLMAPLYAAVMGKSADDYDYIIQLP
jgi:Putative Flp pilus-assembly TadE/G-like